MKRAFRHIFFLLFAASAVAAQAQTMLFSRLHGASVSAGGTGQFNTVLESTPGSTAVTAPSVGGGTLQTTSSDQQQFTTLSAGFLTSIQLHPVSWAGVEMNYGYTHYSERYAFNYATAPSTVQRVNVPTGQHEATAAYLFHPKHIPFQPFMAVGGGAIDFNPLAGSNQWRGAGLLEAGFDLPTPNKHWAFRISGRSLYYRAPNYYTPAISTRSWRVQSEPAISSVYRF